MPGVLLDTHVFAWALLDSPRLAAPARAAIQEADRVCISAVSFYEIGQKVRLGKWPEMAPHAAALPALARRQGAVPLPLSAEAAAAAALLDWPHPRSVRPSHRCGRGAGASDVGLRRRGLRHGAPRGLASGLGISAATGEGPG